MSLFATTPARERSLFFRQYQTTYGIDPVVVEKDFWVCWLLGRIFSRPELAEACVFKGGTSLSKVFSVIRRFSEDIDLAITPASLGYHETDLDDAASNTKRAALVEQMERACAHAVQTRWLPRLESDIRAVLGAPTTGTDWLIYRFDEASRSPIIDFTYPGALPQGVPYISRVVKMEFGSLTDQRPTGHHPVQAFVAELAPGAFSDMEAVVVALELERTFWEKATILHAEFHRPTDRSTAARYARHYADFAALWIHPSAQAARGKFDLLARVRRHKSRFFSSGWANYDTAVPGTLCLVPPEARIAGLRADYVAMGQMFLDEPMRFETILDILRDAEVELNRPRPA